MTDDERQPDSAAATAVGETLSDYFRKAASSCAQGVLVDQQRIALTSTRLRASWTHWPPFTGTRSRVCANCASAPDRGLRRNRTLRPTRHNVTGLSRPSIAIAATSIARSIFFLAVGRSAFASKLDVSEP